MASQLFWLSTQHQPSRNSVPIGIRLPLLWPEDDVELDLEGISVWFDDECLEEEGPVFFTRTSLLPSFIQEHGSFL